MARLGLPGHTRTVVADLTRALRPPMIRAVALGAGLAVALLGHAALGDPRLAWIAVPIALLAGLAGSVRSALAVAAAAAIGHAGIDVALGLAASELPGLLVRSVVLPSVALVGAAGAVVEAQRDQAMQRVISEDPITGLLNVRSFYDELARLRTEHVPFVIVLADIRGMRALNDRWGHPTGTEAMRALAHVLRRSAGNNVVASRLGSDEVALALAGEDRERYQSIVDRIVERLHEEQVALPDGDRFEVHAAYGVAHFPEDGDDEVAVLRAADRAKEQAKAVGLDRVGTAGGEVS